MCAQQSEKPHPFKSIVSSGLLLAMPPRRGKKRPAEAGLPAAEVASAVGDTASAESAEVAAATSDGGGGDGASESSSDDSSSDSAAEDEKAATSDADVQLDLVADTATFQLWNALEGVIHLVGVCVCLDMCKRYCLASVLG